MAEMRAFLSHLGGPAGVSASTQNQALNALVVPLPRRARPSPGRARPRRRAPDARSAGPVVLSRGGGGAAPAYLKGPFRLMAALLFGSGLRLLECCRLRVQDVDLEREQITVRDGKGRKDRVTLLPERLVVPLRDHLERVLRHHRRDLADGTAGRRA